MRTLSIIIPCFNEERTIREIVSRVTAISALGWKKEIIIVDDGSGDGTRGILKEFEDQAKVIYKMKNEGKGSAVADGLKRAAGDLILIQDADLEYSPEEIPRLLEAVKGPDSVIYGSRNLTSRPRKGFLLSRLGVWFMTEMTNLLYGAKLTDIWTCYKLFPNKAKELFAAGRFESEIIFTLKLLRRGFKITEVPISHDPRDTAHGKKIRYRDGFHSIFLIFKDWFRHMNETLFKKPFFWYFVCALLLAYAAVYFLKPFLNPQGDGPSYLSAMEALKTGIYPANFIPNRVLTTFLGLQTVIALSFFSGDAVSAWLFMNVIFYLVACLLFYKIVLKLYGSETTAFIAGLFFAANYAVISFGLNYFMDMGGWMFYIVSIYFLLQFADSKSKKSLFYSAAAIGAGGLFKEYAFLACVPTAVVLTGQYYKEIPVFLKRALLAAAVALIPAAILYAFVYFRFHYTYADWLSFNRGYYVYHSRLAEYLKNFGSLMNLLGIFFLGGLWIFFKNSDILANRKYHLYIVGLFLSILPIFFWPAITQRILFIAVPFAIVIAGAFIKRHEQKWQLWLLTLPIYILASFFMDSFILKAVNLPF